MGSLALRTSFCLLMHLPSKEGLRNWQGDASLDLKVTTVELTGVDGNITKERPWQHLGT